MIYDIIVIGAGSGGLNTAMFMNNVGFKVLLIDKSDENIGGDCLNFGCVPSKALIHTSRLIYDGKESSKFGIKVNGNVDIKKVLKYIKEKQNIIRKHENTSYFKSLGIDVVLGTAKFNSKDSIKVNDTIYFGKKIVIATGSRPRELKIPGIENVKVFNNESIFNIDFLPKKLLCIGGGPIGLEIGQAFARFGSEVSIVEMGDFFLPKENHLISEVLLKQLKKEDIKFYFNTKTIKFNNNKLIVETKGKQKKLDFDAVFVGIGRVPNLDLDLDKAGIKLDKGKLIVDSHLQTTNKKVYAVGDVVGGYMFTHAAELHAGVVINNFFSPFKKRVDYSNFSWVTYTYPEIGTFGLNQDQLKKNNIKYDTLSYSFDDDDRSIVDDFTSGKMLLFVSKGKILGGTMVHPNAGELIQELVLAMNSKLRTSDLFNKIYAYPVASRVNKRIISLDYSKKLTPFTKRVLKWLYK